MTLSIAQTAVREAPPFGQVVFGPITFVTHCDRHGIPFFGRAFIGYVPTSERLAPSTVRRMVHSAARYGETKLARELAAMLEVCLKPVGVALDISSAHDCAGPQLLDDAGTRHIAAWHGRYRADSHLRAEFLARCAVGA